MKGEITRSQLVDLLKTLVEEQRTGTVYVHTDDNHLIAVGVDRGELTSLICGPKRGERAIPMIRNMRSGTFRLEDRAIPNRRGGANLPSTEVLLSMLADDADDKYDNGQISDYHWVQDVICKVLADYMGPIAPLMCRETIKAAGGIDSPDKVRRVIDELAREIDDMAEAKRFLTQTQAELGNRLG